ncbi:MAG: hypothetical protein NDI94_03600, partial [Candidatus Woesearchaeota archaeon]|nr:hypothetical protein [Candidatus Woesearchaeota archaeon]
MNFQHLQKVESAQFYIDVAFNKAKKKVDLGRSSVIARDNLSKSRQIEIERVNIAGNSLKDNLGKIIKHFPVIDDMDDFYKELIKSTLDYVALKKSLGAMKWASSKIDFMVRTYKQKIQRCVELRMINSIRREFYGRVCSVIKQVKDNLTYIEECRRIMRGYPSIKTAV